MMVVNDVCVDDVADVVTPSVMTLVMFVSLSPHSCADTEREVEERERRLCRLPSADKEARSSVLLVVNSASYLTDSKKIAVDSCAEAQESKSRGERRVLAAEAE